MQELIQSLQQKTGLSSEQAQEAISHILNFLKSKLPESLHHQIDNAVSGNNPQNLGKVASEKLEGFSL